MIYSIFYYTLLINFIPFILSQKCLDSKSHKPAPTVEKSLHDSCANWIELACCNQTNTIKFHLTNTTWYGFNYNHCGKISEKCRERFLQELCLYECDPWLGVWTVNDTSKGFRSQRYYEIPLCKNDCNLWYEDCKEDFTCRNNWNKGFRWINGTNTCPFGEECKKIKNVFRTAETFCNQIWDGSFRVTNDSDQCISFTFNTTENPNAKVLKFYSPKNDLSLNFIYYKLLLLNVFLSLVINLKFF